MAPAQPACRSYQFRGSGRGRPPQRKRSRDIDAIKLSVAVGEAKLHKSRRHAHHIGEISQLHDVDIIVDARIKGGDPERPAIGGGAFQTDRGAHGIGSFGLQAGITDIAIAITEPADHRSEKRRVGTEYVMTWRLWGWP